MEKQFKKDRVSEDRRTDYAIEVGLKTMPELQQVMKNRQNNYTRFSPVWSWTDFVYDLSRVNDEAQNLKGQHTGTSSMVRVVHADYVSHNQVPFEVQIQFRTSENRDIDALGVHFPDIHLPDIKIPHIDIDFDKILQRIKPSLDVARHNLERAVADTKASTEEMIKAVHDFIEVQKELLPGEIQYALQEFQKFKADHPYVVAGITVTLVIVGTEIIFPYAFLGVLRLIGFGEVGPVAGCWAAAFQSAFYGGRTRGLFSILQSISMRGKIFWPITVFSDITAAAAGTLVVLPPEKIKELVDEWANHPFPMALDGNVVTAELDQWMVALGEKMTEVEVPHVQWFDVTIEALRQRLEVLAHQ
ncbi:hypothetical protein L218DRAFT_954031 [Marasmius fiardii PR-910]|nr:hypothetical protein L218DRAFT_954031 [Marasmius fiardii PR-910]